MISTLDDLSELRFSFELAAVEDIQPWGEGEDRKLHWFGLTDGHYWISTPLGEALRYTDETLKQWESSSPYVDYQVARFFEDLQLVLPAVLEPVPSDIAALVSDAKWFDCAEQWIAEKEDENNRRERCYEAMDWYQERALDSMHLKNGPIFHFWRTGDKVTIQWEATGKNAEEVWSIPNGKFAVSAQAMQLRVETISNEGLESRRLPTRHLPTDTRTTTANNLD